MASINSMSGVPISNNIQQGYIPYYNVVPNYYSFQNSSGSVQTAVRNPYDNYLNGKMGAFEQEAQQNQFLKCRPVSSKEQAMAFQIDLDGSLWVFTDIGNQRIYTKQINTDGTASFNTYTLGVEKEEKPPNLDFITREEFNKTIQSLITSIQNGQNQNGGEILNFS